MNILNTKRNVPLLLLFCLWFRLSAFSFIVFVSVFPFNERQMGLSCSWLDDHVSLSYRIALFFT